MKISTCLKFSRGARREPSREHFLSTKKNRRKVKPRPFLSNKRPIKYRPYWRIPTMVCTYVILSSYLINNDKNLFFKPFRVKQVKNLKEQIIFWFCPKTKKAINDWLGIWLVYLCGHLGFGDLELFFVKWSLCKRKQNLVVSSFTFRLQWLLFQGGTLTWSPAAQKINFKACLSDEPESGSFLLETEMSSSSPLLSSLPNTQVFTTG